MKKSNFPIMISLLLMPLMSAEANNSLYTTIEGGYATQKDLPSTAEINAVSLDNKNSGLRGSIGYNHDFSNMIGLALEAALGKYGDAQYTYADGNTSTVKSSVSEFLAVLTLHANQWDLFFKGGETRQRMEVYGLNAPSTGSNIHPELAVGTAYNFNRHVAATLTYAHVFGDQVTAIEDLGGSAPSLNELLLGLRYNFSS